MRDKILRMELYGKFEDESLIKEVLAAFPLRVENTLTYYRTKILGKVPTDRNSYDPAPILSAIPGGEKVMVLDSNNLPEDWKDYNFSDLLSQEDHEEASISSRTIARVFLLYVVHIRYLKTMRSQTFVVLPNLELCPPLKQP